MKRYLREEDGPAQKRLTWQGLPICIETPCGEYRRGVDVDGHAWESLMPADYGYFEGVQGNDGDCLDCFVGDYLDSGHVVVVQQIHPDTQTYDEDKCLIGFSSPEEAINVYLDSYDRVDHVGNIEVWDTLTFLTKLHSFVRNSRKRL